MLDIWQISAILRLSRYLLDICLITILLYQISQSGTRFKLFVSQYSMEKSGGCRLWDDPHTALM